MADDDIELREQLMKTLEQNGTLGKIKAQLRAAIYLAAEDLAHFQKKPPLVDAAVKDLLATERGGLMLYITQNTLQQLQMQSTLAVFQAECKHLLSDSLPNGNQVSDQLHLSPQAICSEGGCLAAMIDRLQSTTTNNNAHSSSKSPLASPLERADSRSFDLEDPEPKTPTNESVNGIGDKKVESPKAAVQPLLQSISINSTKSLDESPRLPPMGAAAGRGGSSLPPLMANMTMGGQAKSPDMSLPKASGNLVKLLNLSRNNTIDEPSASSSTTSSPTSSARSNTARSNTDKSKDGQKTPKAASPKPTAKPRAGSSSLPPVTATGIFRKDNTPPESVNGDLSEEIVEELDVDELLVSGRSVDSF